MARELGGEGRTSLVLLHGLLGSSRNWQSAGAELASAAGGRRVCALDLRNHGRSPWHDRMDYDAMVADVTDWILKNSTGPVDLLGHSMGGKVAMAIACRRPDLVRKLMVVDIAPRAYLSRAHRAEFAAMNELRLAELKSRGEAELKFEARVPDWGMRKFLTTNLERGEDGRWRWIVNLPVLTAALPVVEGNPLNAGELFRGSALFLRGGKSGYVTEEDAQKVPEFFPTAKLVTLPSAGHNPHMETRAEFCAEVAAFLA